MELNREKVLENYNQVEEMIKELQQKLKKDFKYNTGDRYLTGFAIIRQVTDMKELVEIMSYLKKQITTDASAAEELGIDPAELEDEDEKPTICGYLVDEWIEDVKTRKEELDVINKIDKLMRAKELLKKNLSEDDLFKLEMSAVSDLLK